MKQELGTVIARRRYFKAGDERQLPLVEVEIGAPAKSPHSKDEFLCSLRVTLADSERTEIVYGIDELQALLLALGYLEAILRRLDCSSDLRWVGDENGDLGIRIPNFAS